MSRDYSIVDVDAHYLEPVEELAEYFDAEEPWHMRLQESPDTITPSSSPTHYLYGRITRDEVGYLEGKMTPDSVPHIKDHLGIDKIILLSHTGLVAAMISSQDDRPYILARGYLEYMLDRVIGQTEHVYTAIPAPHQDPHDCVELIDEYGDEESVIGVCMITSGPEPPLGHRKYDIVYEAAQDRDLPIIFHGGGSDLDSFQIKGFERFIETHSLGFLWSNMAQLTSVVMQGVPEKFPDLDFVFQEAGIMWVPAYMGRLDAEFLKRQAEAPLLEKRPSEYMKEFYYGIQPFEHPFDMEYFERAIAAMGGASQLMYASDYPHWDYDPPSTITDLPFLSLDEKERILGRNAEEVFGI